MFERDQQQLVEISFTSEVAFSMSRKDLITFVRLSRAWNERNALTGILFFHSGRFACVLEGTEVHVNMAWQRADNEQCLQRVSLLEKRQIIMRNHQGLPLQFFAEDGLDAHYPKIANALKDRNSTGGQLLHILSEIAVY